jgi:hypothetical protein
LSPLRNAQPADSGRTIQAMATIESTGGSWHSAQTAAETYTCIEPGCDRAAKARKGPASRCPEHRAERKRAREAANGAEPAEVPTEATDNGQPAETPHHAEQRLSPTTGRMERAALQLAAAGRELDSVLREHVELRAKIGAAVQAWRSALEELPDATNGHAPTL